MATKKLIVDASVMYAPKVSFIGEHFTKRELDVVMRAIRRAHKERILDFRKKRIIEKYEADKAAEAVLAAKQAKEAKQKSEVKEDGKDK